LSEYRKYIDYILKEELGPLYIGIPSLYKVFFRKVKGLKEVNAAVFKKYKEGTICDGAGARHLVRGSRKTWHVYIDVASPPSLAP